MSSTRNHKQKLLRAYHHLEEVERLRKAWLDRQQYAVVTTRDPSDADYFLCEVITGRPQIEGFSVAVGDCLQNLRNGLDHLAYELALAYTEPLPDDLAQDSEFPIFGDEDRQGNRGIGSALFHRVHRRGFKQGLPAPSSGLAKTRGMNPVAQAVIEGLQPYHRGTGYVSDPLWVLHDLARVDKHRLLHPIVSSTTAVALDFEHCVNVHAIGRASGESTIETFPGTVEGRAVIARIPVIPVDARREVHVETLPLLDIAFDKTTPAAGEPVADTLGDIYNYIVTKVLPPLAPFL